MSHEPPSPAPGLSQQQKDLLRLLVAEDGIELPEPTDIPRRPRQDRAPLSFAQQRLWFLCQFNPRVPAYNISSALRIHGALDVRTLRRSLAEVVRRHEALRTVFALEGGESVQIVLAAGAVETPVRVADLGALAAPIRDSTAGALAAQEALVPFELEGRPLLRATLLVLGEADHAILLTLHHMIADAWSLGLLVKELVEIYKALAAGRPNPLPELALQYADFALWQRSLVAGERLAGELRYWRRQLAGLAKLELPADRPRPAVQTFRGAVRRFAVAERLAGGLRGLARSLDASLFMVALAAFKVLLARLSSENDVSVGTPIANRTRVATESLIGFFVNTLVLRTDLSGDLTFRELALRVRDVTLAAYAHQDLPFERLVEELRPARDLAHTPLFQNLFVLHNVPVQAFEISSLRLAPFPLERRTAKFDVTLVLNDLGPYLEGSLEHSTDLFDAATVQRFLEQYRLLLEQAVAAPGMPVDKMSLLAGAERHQIVREWNDTTTSYPQDRCLHEILAEQARRAPDAVAVVAGDSQLSYAELDRRAGRLAGVLRRLGGGPEARVGVLMERSCELMIALLGVLQAGAAYVPLDPDYPRQRLAHMLVASQAGVLLGERQLCARVAGDSGGDIAFLDPAAVAGPTTPPRPPAAPRAASPDNLVYVIFTSGSTGMPKGAMNSHRAVVNRLLWMQDAYRLTAADRVLQKTPLSFDVSVWELFWPLMAGARLVLARPGGQQDSAYLAALVRREGITTLHFVPSMLQVFLGEEGLEDLTSLRTIVCSGEALPKVLVERCRRRLAARLHNLYGPTEAAIDVTAWPCDATGDRTSVPIGRPIANLRLHLLDRELRVVPIGATGELYIGGAGLARGYLGQPDLTAASFVPDGVGNGAGARLYRTGDLGRLLPSGEIEFLGRRDHQTKVRGFRVELGEIEHVLGGHPAVRECAVAARGRGALDRRLVAYLTVRRQPAPAVEELRAFAGERLPQHMIPAAFLFLDELPRTPSGKLDRTALPEIERARPHLAAQYVAPRTAIEEILAGIWSRVLDLERVGVHDNFFALGGDSILSVRILGLARDLGVPFALQQIFRHPTVAALAEVIAASPRPAMPLHSEPFSLLAADDRRRLPAGLDDAYPMTRLQLGMLYHMELLPEHPLFRNVNSWRLRAAFDPGKLQLAVARVVARHPVLRTSFHLTGFREPLQLVHREADLPVGIQDLRHLAAGAQAAAIQAHFDEQEATPFTVTGAPLMRLYVHRLSDEVFQFSLTEHHAIADGWSLHSTLAEMFSAYLALLRGEPLPPPAALKTSLRDYVALEREALDSAEQRAYWSRRLAGCSPLELPALPVSADAQTDRRMRRIGAVVPATVEAALRGLAGAAEVPLKSVLLAVHLKAMSWISGQDDLVIGMVTNGRPEQADGELIRGLFLNVVPLRFRLAPCSWAELARQAFEAEQDLLPYRRFPLAEIQKQFGRRRLVNAEFNFIHFHVVEDVLRLGEIDVQASGGRAEQTDMLLAVTFGLTPVTDRLYINLRFDTGRIPQFQAQALLDTLLGLLEEAGRAPAAGHESAPRTAPGERHLLLHEWSGEQAAATPAATLPELIVARAARQPDAVAIVCGEDSLSYGQLAERAEQVARALLGRGARPGGRIAVVAQRSPATVIALLAAQRTGAAYAAIDPAWPAARIGWLLADLDANVILAPRELATALPAASAPVVWLGSRGQSPLTPPAPCDAAATHPATDLEAPAVVIDAAMPAYVSYTSGSTGRPKGVPACHGSVVNYIAYLEEEWRLGRKDTVLQTAGLNFDASVRDIFAPLACGARLILPATEESAREPAALLASIDRHGVTAILSIVPTLLRELLASAHLASYRSPRLLLVSGEPLHGADCKRVREVFGPDLVLVNQYGPTECTMTSLFHRVPGDFDARAAVPIGSPIRNARVRVLDRRLELAPLGTPGEIYLGGSGLGPGYFRRPDLTAERFVPDPFATVSGARLYRTGDLGRILPGGRLEFGGRVDRQLKVRGVRIEPGEIEAVLGRHPDIAAAAVAVRARGEDEAALVAYVVARQAPAPAPAELRRHLARELPEMLTPAVFVELESLPRLANGKVDHRALPEAPETRPTVETEFVAPRTRIEEGLAQVWAELLGIEAVGIHDDFFELGGHSLMATRLIARVRNLYRVKLPLRVMFEHPTVAGLGQAIEDELAKGEVEGDDGIERLERGDDLQLDVDALPQDEVDRLLGELLATRRSVNE